MHLSSYIKLRRTQYSDRNRSQWRDVDHESKMYFMNWYLSISYAIDELADACIAYNANIGLHLHPLYCIVLLYSSFGGL